MKSEFEKKEPKSELEIFRVEIRAILEQEMGKKKRGEGYNPHFNFIDPEQLTDADLLIYKKFKDKTLTRQDFLEYKAGMANFDMYSARACFQMWLSNQISTLDSLDRSE
jgi:hypothetical protein